ncbi:MAG: mevalonate kinase [Promethearchaeota archaeon]
MRGGKLVEGSAPGKVILFGEHAVVYGKLAVATAIDVRSHCMVEPWPAGSGLVRLQDYNVEFEVPAREPGSGDDGSEQGFAGLLAFLDNFQRRRGASLAGLRATIWSELPPAMGLGSSASVLAALAVTLSACHELDLGLEQLREDVLAGERRFHGKPSGIDHALCLAGGTHSFEAGRLSPLHASSKAGQLDLLVVSSGVPRQTANMVAKVARLREREPGTFERVVDRIDAVAREGARALEMGDLQEVGRLMYENHELLVELGVSHPTLDGLVNICREAGALGAKLTGGGGGGCVVVACAPGTEEAVERRLVERGFRHFAASADAPGARATVGADREVA